EPFQDLLNRRFVSAGSYPVKTSKGTREVKRFDILPTIEFDDFMAHVKKGYRFKPKSDWESWAQKRGQL
ncbi:MAG: hypothetical protein AAF492_01860, partial [Verrucomicrobiota bacterium]